MQLEHSAMRFAVLKQSLDLWTSRLLNECSTTELYQQKMSKWRF